MFGYSFYHVCTAVAGLLLAGVMFMSQGGKGAAGDRTSPEFRRFQTRFLVVFFIMMAADWMQGAYVYKLYEHYGFSMAENGQLFIAGFGSSMVFGIIAGPMVDKYGRKRGCLAYGALYIASCTTKHFNSFPVLMLGRIFGGAATSILFSAFEAWMVAAHTARGFNPEWLSTTFSRMYVGNGLVAIASGWLAQLAYDYAQHPVAPFDVSIAFLAAGSAAILLLWSENYGDAKAALATGLGDAIRLIRSDSQVMLLGASQGLFEGAMFTFVFMWTPSLEDAAPGQDIPHGIIFAAFMICASLGGAIFRILSQRQVLEVFMRSVFFIAAISMFIVAFSTNGQTTFLAFLLFEVCVGVFWPGMGTLRSKCIPEETRATVINLFRVPLNLMVCILLVYVDQLRPRTVFLFCALLHSICCFLFTRLIAVMKDAASAKAKEESTPADLVAPGGSH